MPHPVGDCVYAVLVRCRCAFELETGTSRPLKTLKKKKFANRYLIFNK